MDDEKLLCMMRALSDPNRLTILRILKGRRLCSCQILKDMDISQPTLSHHMSYEIDEEALGFLNAALGDILRT